MTILGHAAAHFPGMYFAPNTGSLCGIGGNAQAPVPGGRMLASTCTSIRQGFPSAMAWASAPLKSSDFVAMEIEPGVIEHEGEDYMFTVIASHGRMSTGIVAFLC
jgi:hypothetical protein